MFKISNMQETNPTIDFLVYPLLTQKIALGSTLMLTRISPHVKRRVAPSNPLKLHFQSKKGIGIIDVRPLSLSKNINISHALIVSTTY